MTPSQDSVPPPTPTPAFGTIGCGPAWTRGSRHMMRAPLLSLLRRSVAGSRRGPASSTTTEAPRAVSSYAARLPQAPAPTMTTSARGCMWRDQPPVYAITTGMTVGVVPFSASQNWFSFTTSMLSS